MHSHRPALSFAALIRVLLLVLVAAAPGWSHALTALWYQRDATDIEPAFTRLLQAPTDTFTVAGNVPGYLLVRVNYDSPNFTELTLAAPTGAPFALGAFEGVARAAFRGTAPGLDFTAAFGCSIVTGRFAVLELVVDGGGNATSFAANFEHHCEGMARATYGEIRINSSVPLTMGKPANSTSPDPFSFTPRTGLAPSTMVESNSTTVYGINAPSTISISGGEYSVNGGAYTSQAGQVVNRDHVTVRATSSSNPGGLQTSTLTIGDRSAPFTLTTYAPGQPINAFYMRSFAGDYIGGGETLDWRAPQLAVTARHDRADEVQLELGYGSRFKSLRFAAPLQAPIALGAYEEAASFPLQGSSPGLDFYGDGRGCNRILGRFVVLDADFGPGATVNRFAANFEQWCDNNVAPSIGEIRYNSSVPLSPLLPPGDSQPDPFRLTASSPVQAKSFVYSNWIRIYGVNAPVPIGIDGGEYSLNGAAFTSAPGVAHELDDIVVRTVASITPGATVQATLDAGGRSATLAATTWQQGMNLTGLYYQSPSGEYIGQEETRLFLSPDNVLTPTRNYKNGIEVELTGVGGKRMILDLSAPGQARIETGAYEGAIAFPQASDKPGINFFGDGRGCSQIAGRFVVHEAVYNGDGSVQRLAVDFEQRCEVTGPPLYAELRVNSSVAFSALKGVACTPGDADSDGVPDCVEAAEGLNPVLKDNDVFANPRLFVMQQYRDFLTREGDAGGIGFYAGQVASNTMSRGEVIEGFFGSPEFQGTVAPVVRLYSAYFARLPDYTGLNFWIGFKRQGNSLGTISQYFAQSGEFQSRYGALDNGQFVSLVYQNVLGRAPDAGGFAYWKGLLDQNSMTRGDVMLGFSESGEYRAATASDVYVTMTYLGMLHRAPDAGGFDFWTGYLDGGNSGLALINGFLNSSEYRSRFLP
jgi:hypothetical protein